MAPEELPDPVAVALAVARIFDDLGIVYLIGGSFASSVHGEPRSTNDVDFLAALVPEQVRPLLAALGPGYYASEEAARAAAEEASSFNLIHMASAVKVNVFVAGRDPFNAERLRFRQSVQVYAEPRRHLFVDTAEHSVLRKLEWFRRGGEVSERQVRDVVAMLRVQGTRLDRGRLFSWAARLGVSDLLDRALRESETMS